MVWTFAKEGGCKYCAKYVEDGAARQRKKGTAQRRLLVTGLKSTMKANVKGTSESVLTNTDFFIMKRHSLGLWGNF